MEHKYTHTGTLYGDARTGDKKPTVALRETKNFWVSKSGNKYRKISGSGMGDYPIGTGY